MSNQRRQIRAAFKELLRGKTRALFSVHSATQRPIWEEDLPAINIWASDEQVEIMGSSPLRYKRSLEVTIELYASEVHEPEDRMDDFLAEVETLVDGEDLFSLGDLVDSITYTGSHIEYKSDTIQVGIVATLSYSVGYYTTAGVDPAILGPLEGIDADWDSTSFTRDEIDLPQT